MSEPNTTAAGCGCASIITLGIIQLIITGIAFGGIAFVIIMLIDCIKHEKEKKELWIIIIIVGQLPGSIAYYFARKKKRNG